MSDLLVVGLSHHTAPLWLRERLAVDGAALAELMAQVRGNVFAESVVLSTCNRVEFYGAADDPAAAAARARTLLAERAGRPLEQELYTHRGRDAVRHTFRVTSSLDSMVVGEPQILGQVKQAFEAAQDLGAVGMILGRCFQRALAVAKRVRSETRIAEGTVSVSSIASELALKIFGDLCGRHVVLLGAGEMGEAAAKAISNSGARLRVVNRSVEKAKRIVTECGGEAVSIENLAAELVNADVVITSTSSPKYVLTLELMRDVVRARRHRPLFVIDIAVPRDVDPRVGELENVFCYDVDDLQQVAEQNMALRRKEAAAAERIVEIEVTEFEAWRRSLDLTPTIVRLRSQFTDVVRGELERTLPRLGELSTAERKALDKMTQAIVNKLLHRPLSALKRSSGQPEGADLIATARRLFQLDEDEAAEAEVAERAGASAALTPKES